MEKANFLAGEYKLGEYTIQYKGDNVKMVKAKTNEGSGIMFLSRDMESIQGIFLEIGNKIKITNICGIIEYEDKKIMVEFPDCEW